MLDSTKNSSRNSRRHVGFKLSLLTSAIALAFGWQSPIFAASVSDTLTIRGTAGAACSISITPASGATTLPITTAGAQVVTVGRVLQTCNNAAGYTLEVASGTCSTAPTGAKLSDGATHNLAYSVNADNTQPPDGTWEVTGLLASACTGQIARTVVTTVTADNTDLGVAFTGNATLFPGTYQDVITVTMTTS